MLFKGIIWVNMEYAVAIQELFLPLCRRYVTAEQLISECTKRCNEQIVRIYLGNSFCGKLFNKIAVSQFRFFYDHCISRQMKITLTIPIFTQGDLAAGKRTVQSILEKYGNVIDEITVNDCGMYEWLSKIFNGRIFSGRLMNKVNRDPRYPEYGKKKVYVPEPPVMTAGAELDACSAAMVIESDSEDYTVAVYNPYTYLSTGEICSYASFYSDPVSKFTPIETCPAKCGSYFTVHKDDRGNTFYHIGNTIYFKTDLPEIIGTDKQRLIYVPLELWEGEV